MKNFQTFPDDVKIAVMRAQRGICKKCLNKIHSIHHMLHNTKPNRNKFPKFIHSIFNAVGLCLHCHDNFPHEFKVTLGEAIEYEAFL